MRFPTKAAAAALSLCLVVGCSTFLVLSAQAQVAKQKIIAESKTIEQKVAVKKSELAPKESPAHTEKMEAEGITKGTATLHATDKGGKAAGKITFTKEGDGIKVEGEVTGLAPGAHGFHIHEFGDISSPDAMSAGGHFNPEKMQHAGLDSTMRHVGDLGNIEANDKGVAKVDVLIPNLTFSGADSILGRGLIVHEKADDFKTQPTGNAGARVAAAVIGVGKP